MIYIDTSVLVAYYCPENISEQVEQILLTSSKPVISQLTEVELISAVSRKTRQQELTKQDADLILSVFKSHIDNNSFVYLPINTKHFSKVADWIAKFDTPLRTLDALHLAVASINQIPLVTADIKFYQSANNLGVNATLIQ